MEARYYRFSRYLKERFGCRVHKVSVDAGFSCPNKDGRMSRDGCIYCDNRGFSFNSRSSPRPLELQIKEGINFGKKRFKAEKFIVYFQAYTNTYLPARLQYVGAGASPEILRERYDAVRKFDDVVGISIATRPDCVDEEILDLIKSYTEDYEVWLEYGLQSAHDKTLEFINRGHTYEDFLGAVKLTRKRKSIKICAHVIVGLPNETREEILATAKALGQLKLEGIKIHPLHVIRGTKLEELYQSKSYAPLAFDEYVDLAVDFLEYLSPGTVVQRISADCPEEFLAAPAWMLAKDRVLKAIDEKLLAENKFQGRLYNC